MGSHSFHTCMCKISNLESRIQLHSTFSCSYWHTVYKLRPWTSSKWEKTFPSKSCKAVRRRVLLMCCLDKALPGEASATEKKEACILCGNALLPNALWLQLVPDHMTLDHIDERDSGFARVSCSLEVTNSSVSTPARQWKKVIILPASPFLSVGKCKDIQQPWRTDWWNIKEIQMWLEIPKLWKTERFPYLPWALLLRCCLIRLNTQDINAKGRCCVCDRAVCTAVASAITLYLSVFYWAHFNHWANFTSFILLKKGYNSIIPEVRIQC